MKAITFRPNLAFLDQARFALLEFIHVHEVMDELCWSLKAIHDSLPESEWKATSASCLDHPLSELLHQDPLTNRAFTKPRGYPGDARLMDFIYQKGSVQVEVNSSTRLGQQLYEYTSNSPAARAVRSRRDVTAGIIDREASASNSLTILSFACGHMDEASLSCALRNGAVGKYVGFDQDAESLSVVRNELGHLSSVHCIQGSVQEFLYGKQDLGQYDLIYSLGLFDYLPPTVARMLTEALFEILNPGGCLLIANFAPGIRDLGYMESFMDWKLIYRNAAEMAELAEEITDSIAAKHVFQEENQSVVFLEIRKN
jgi:extracellular factor (EF) 3-hydroxypalmitic acid methyl ester biosynthesis protein